MQRHQLTRYSGLFIMLLSSTSIPAANNTNPPPAPQTPASGNTANTPKPSPGVDLQSYCKQHTC